MTNTLKSRAIRAVQWSFIESVSLQAVRFVIGVVLARLLSPADFGAIGMLTIFTVAMQAFLDGGFVASLVQKRNPTPTDICSIFYLNIAVGLLAAGGLCLVAPWIAGFYGLPILTPLMRALSLTIVIDSFGLIQSTLLTKRIDFKSQTKVSLIASFISGVIGISLAWRGFGLWSLAIQQISSSFLRTVFLWVWSSWRPSLLFSCQALRALFGFGSRMLLANVLNHAFDQIYLVVIGKLFSAAELGFFTRAKTLQELPASTLSGLVTRVTLPVFASIQEDRLRVKTVLRKAMTTLVLVNSPLMVGLAVVAHPLVITLLTEKWAPAVPALQLLCVAGLLLPIQTMNLNVLTALGRSDLFLRLEIVKKTLVVLGIAVTWQWGVLSMVWGMLGVAIISCYVNTYYTGRLVNYPLREQLRDVSSYAGVAAIMGVATFVIGLLPGNARLVLLLQIAAGAGIYVCLCWLFRLSAFVEVWQDLLQLRRLGEARESAMEVQRQVILRAADE